MSDHALRSPPIDGIAPSSHPIGHGRCFAVAGVAGASGLMAIYVAGLVLGNARLPHRSTTDSFVEGLAWLEQWLNQRRGVSR